MKAFVQNSSIVRRLLLFIAAVSVLLLLECAGLYFSSATQLQSLAEIHQYNRITEIARQVRQITDSRAEILERIAAEGPKPETQLVLKGANGQAKRKVEEALVLGLIDPKVSELLSTMNAGLLEFDSLAQAYFRTAATRSSSVRDELERQLLILRQLEIESRDTIAQAQIYAQEQTSRIFDGVYSKRHLPLQVGVVMTVSFVIFALVFGLSLARQINLSIQNFLEATSAIAGGNVAYRAPILICDEIGRITDSFNNMADALVKTTVSKDYVENVIESMTDLVIVLTAEGKIQRVNEVASSLLGYRKEDLYEQKASLLFADPQPKLGVQDLDGEGKFRNTESTLVAKDGARVPALVSASVIRERDGKFLGMVCVAKDITDLKRAEEELRSKSDELHKLYQQVRQANDSLLVSNKELESFSYSVSHDLRAPLRSIDGFSQALLEDQAERLDEQGKNHLKRVRAATQRMGELIDDLLSLASVARHELKRTDVDVSAIARQVGQQLQSSTPDREVEWVVSGVAMAHADSGLIRIVLENLLGNAFKFTAKTPKACIEFGQGQKDGKNVFFLKDNGAGFDMAHYDKLFGAFQRLHAYEDFVGTGIGLATTRRIIQRHGGEIWAEGAVGKGATFYFTL